MRKHTSVPRTSLLIVLLTLFVGVVLNQNAYAKKRSASAKAGATKSKATQRKKSRNEARVGGKAGRKASARADRARVAKEPKEVRHGRRGAGRESKAEAAKVEALLRKRGRLNRSERRVLSQFRDSKRRRARAIALARMRAVRARDEALRNITAGNIAKDNSTGEDPEVRAATLNALQGRSGTVVVMDPTNGRIYSIVNQRMALGSPVKPCSTVKLIVGLASLHENVFDPNEDVQISRNASMNLTDALARSNNPVFQVLGRMLGYERVVQYAANFGFGERTGINYAGESEGFLPEQGDQETGHMSSHGDGFGITAVQLAAFTSALANGGTLYVPRVPQSLEEAENFQPVVRRRIEMSAEDRLRLMAGMIGAVNYGTAKLAYNPISQVAGKTGTCTGSSDKLGLFTSFSSVDNPRLAITVITTGSTEAGKRAAEIAGRIYSALTPRFFRDRMMTPAASAEVTLNPHE